MFAKFFKPSVEKRASVLLTITTLISYFIGLIRDRIIAVNFGATSQTDIYNASFLIPDFLFNLFIAGALMASFMPIFSDFLTKDPKRAHKIANTILTYGSIFIVLLSVLAFIFTTQLIEMLFPEFDGNTKLEIIKMTRIMLPTAILFTISNSLGNILMSYKHFFSYAVSPILYNLGIITGILLFSEKFGIYSAAIGVIAGAILHCIIRIIDTMNTPYKYYFKTDIKDEGFKKIIKLMIPRTISLISWQINLYIFALIGIQMMEGSLASFNFARNIQSIAVSLFGVALSTAAYPYLTEFAASNDKISYTKNIQNSIQKILFFTIPSMIGVIFLTKPIIEIILSGGKFDSNSVNITALILFFFAFSIPFESMTHILSRAFYALKNTKTPMYVNLTGMVIIGLITFYIAPKYGVKWFSIGFSIGMITQVILLIILLKKHLAGFNLKKFSLSFMKIILSSGIMGSFIILSSNLTLGIPNKIYYTMQIIIAAIIYFICAHILKSEEISGLKTIFAKFQKTNQ
ncbi:MAG: murein biosynthesis integral membrane protein MurJ [Candidatus Gracilibacteria bacterium]|jgi:putative peptidoglycan lipid II flippase